MLHPWTGYENNKLYLQSGLTTTVDTSASCSSYTTAVYDIGNYDNVNTPVVDSGLSSYDLLLVSGQFTTTVKTSLSAGFDNYTTVGYDGTDTPTAFGNSARTVYELRLLSGQFSSTVKSSADIFTTPGEGAPTGGDNTTDGLVGYCFASASSSTLWLQSGYSSTVRDSQSASGNYAWGIAYDGTDTPVAEYYSALGGNSIIRVYSGRFTTTVKGSVDVTTVDDTIRGIGGYKLLTNYTLDAASGAVTITGSSTNLERGYHLDGGAGTVVISGSDVDLLGDLILHANSGSVLINGTEANLEYGVKVNADAGAVIIAGSEANLERSYLVNADSDSVIINGSVANLKRTHLFEVSSGTVVINGSDSDFQRSYRLSADSGTVVISGSDTNLERTRLFEVDAGTVVINGSDTNLEYSRRVSADSGSVVIDGSDANLEHNTDVDVGAGTVVIAGSDVSLLHDRILAAEADNVVITGSDVTLTYTGSYQLIAESGSVEIAGSAALLKKASVLLANGGDVNIVGSEANTLGGSVVNGETGEVVLAGTATLLAKGFLVPAASDNVVINGSDATLTHTSNATIIAEPGSVLINGSNATLSYSGGGLPSYTLTAESGEGAILAAPPTSQAYLRGPAEEAEESDNGCYCTDINLDIEQTLFLGCSVQSFSAQAGWNATGSTLDVVLYEDYCFGSRVWYAPPCLEKQTDTNVQDAGFLGEPRWQRHADYVVNGTVRFPAGSAYSSCTKEKPLDTLIRPGINLEGMAAYFRFGDFEWTGIISDWVKDVSCEGYIRYRVKLIDPKVVLEKTNVVIGDYQGAVTCDGVCANTNLINVYGLMEYINGVPCTAYGQEAVTCPPGGTWGAYDTIANLIAGGDLGVDQLVFGTPTGGFGGSSWTEDGMPWSRIFFGLNYLVNKVPTVVGDGSGFDDFSPYGRIVFCGPTYYYDPSNPNDPVDGNTPLQDGFPLGFDLLETQFAGLMPNDGNPAVCADGLEYYFLDISELSQVFDSGNFFDCGGTIPTALDSTYRLSGTSMSVMEMIEQMSNDFGFDYYIELVPVKYPDIPTCTTIVKFIKLRIINKKINGAANNAICAQTDFVQCASQVSTGREMRTDATSRFVVGAHKQTIFQAKQDTNPDGAFNGGNTSEELAGYDIITGPHTDSVCEEMDNMIIPYMGVDQNKDIVNTCIISGEYCFDLPTIGVAQALRTVIFNDDTVRVAEGEFRAALVDFEAWKNWVMDTDVGHVVNKSEIGQSIRAVSGEMAKIRSFNSTKPADNNSKNPIDWAVPRIDRFDQFDDPRFNDLQTLYDWVRGYASKYYGSQWAVRVPFTCCYPDFENNRTRVSERPTNDGGWTEVCEVLGLPNNVPDGNLGDEYELLSFFRDETQKIKPFVGFSNGILKDTSGLSKDSFFYRWIEDGLATDTGAGPPTESSAPKDVYVDTITGMIYVSGAAGSWLRISEIPILVTTTNPAVGVNPGQTLPETAPFIWANKTTGNLFVVWSYTQQDSGLLWTPNTGYIINDLVVNEDNYQYKATNAGTSALPGPTHGAGTVADGGGVLWEYQQIIEPYKVLAIDYDGTMTVDLYVKANVESDYAFHDSSRCFAPRVVVSVPSPIFDLSDDLMYELSGGAFFNATGDPADDARSRPGAEDALLPQQPSAAMIAAAAIPIKHHEINYGPWCNPGNPSWGGELLQDDQFAPWNFGSYAAMNQAGQFYACAGRKDGKGAEIGNITVPGYPTLPLGAELGSMTGFGGQYLVENRVMSDEIPSGQEPDGTPFLYTYKFVDFGNVWEGNFGPNITSISVNVNQGCDASTTYSFRSYTPRKTGFDRKVIEQLQKANRINQELTKRLKKLEDVTERLSAFTRE